MQGAAGTKAKTTSSFLARMEMGWGVYTTGISGPRLRLRSSLTIHMEMERARAREQGQFYHMTLAGELEEGV